MTRTKKERIADTFVKKVKNAMQNAQDADTRGDTKDYWYWKGVAHGLSRGWDIAQGCCLE